MKLEIDTKNWFKDRTFTAIVIIGILTIANTIMLWIMLAHQCNMHNMEMPSQWMNHTMMIRR